MVLEMGTDKLRLSAVRCLGGKATEFNIRIAWARSESHGLNIWGWWFFGCLAQCLCHVLWSTLGLGEQWESTEAAWCRWVLLCSAISHCQVPHPKPSEVQQDLSNNLHGVRAAPACPEYAICQRLGSALLSPSAENICFSLLYGI